MLLILKVTLTPLLVMLVTFASRKWGATVGGLIAGLPLTSGPVSFFFALQQGPTFAHEAVIGTMLGLVGVTLYVMAYERLARRYPWWLCVVCATAVFAAVTISTLDVHVPLAVAAACALVGSGIALLATPRSVVQYKPHSAPWWDIPVRVAIATTLVLVLTGVAHLLGPQLAGAISPFPVFVTVMTVFIHRGEGGIAAAALLRGVIQATLPYVAFFVVVGTLIEYLPVPVTYSLALLLALMVSIPALAPRRRIA